MSVTDTWRPKRPGPGDGAFGAEQAEGDHLANRTHVRLHRSPVLVVWLVQLAVVAAGYKHVVRVIVVNLTVRFYRPVRRVVVFEQEGEAWSVHV